MDDWYETADSLSYEEKVNLLESTDDPIEGQMIFDDFTEEEKDRYLEEIESKSYHLLNEDSITPNCTDGELGNIIRNCVSWNNAIHQLDEIMGI